MSKASAESEKYQI